MIHSMGGYLKCNCLGEEFVGVNHKYDEKDRLSFNKFVGVRNSLINSQNRNAT